MGTKKKQKLLSVAVEDLNAGKCFEFFKHVQVKNGFVFIVSVSKYMKVKPFTHEIMFGRSE